MNRSIRWRIAIPFMTLILLVIGILSAYLLDRFREAHLVNLRGRLQAEAELVGALAIPYLSETETATQSTSGESPLEQAVSSYASHLGARITLIRTDGKVLADSEAYPEEMDNHRYRPEIRDAFNTGEGSALRRSATLGQEMMYVAIRVQHEGQVMAVSRAALPVGQIDLDLRRLRRLVTATAIPTLAVALALALHIAGLTSRPLTQLTRVAERMTHGDLSSRSWPSTEDEVGRLAAAFNQMANELEQQVSTLQRERNQTSGVLTHMADGVLIVDAESRVMLINPSAARILNTTRQDALGHSLAQAARQHQLMELYQKSKKSGTELAATIEIPHSHQFLQIIVTPVVQDDRPGSLIILQDLTSLRRLETVRRDFVSNISHELRTPLASLTALMETLQGGALNDPPAAQRFISLAVDEIESLTQMVEELLQLARIQSSQVPLAKQPTTVEDIVRTPVERLRPQAERGGLELAVEIPQNLGLVVADAQRIYQVMTNIVHNAIKFTQPGGRILVSASDLPDEVQFSIQDTGVGISAENLPRIFERFFKADRSRSGRGTGLGLAISKQLILAHRGRIWAESTEGEGSTFYFTLPKD